ncbi:phage gp6-like head-tail connector protein [Micromonospora sp. NPDC051196]|uniref:phage gp6-like head-tail connector protein n=1 Tax=Micromonospora sp. NPDC051196 TaxID=3155281 RepID=UPI003429B2FA
MLYATPEELNAMRGNRPQVAQDVLLRALRTSCRAIDRKTGRRPGGFGLANAPSARVYEVQGRVTPDGRLLVDDIGSTDGLIVEVETGTDTWSVLADVRHGPDNTLALDQPITYLVLAHRHRWPWRRIQVTARWGWPAVPEEIGMAALLLANRLYLRKDSPEGLVQTQEFGGVRLSRWDPDVEALLAPYVLPGIA